MEHSGEGSRITTHPSWGEKKPSFLWGSARVATRLPLLFFRCSTMSDAGVPQCVLNLYLRDSTVICARINLSLRGCHIAARVGQKKCILCMACSHVPLHEMCTRLGDDKGHIKAKRHECHGRERTCRSSRSSMNSAFKFECVACSLFEFKASFRLDSLYTVASVYQQSARSADRDNLRSLA